MLRSLTFLNLRRLVRQPVRALLGIVSIAAGTALAVGVLIDSASVDRSIAAFAEQRAGTGTLEVVGPGGPAGLDAATLPRIEAVDGVASAVPLIATVTIAEDAAGTEQYILAFGVDCRVEAVLGEVGCDQSQLDSLPGAFAVSGALAERLGADGVVRTNAGRRSMANAVPTPELDAFNDGDVALFSLPDAQRSFGHEGALSSILVVADEGVSDAELAPRLQAAAGEHNVVRQPGIVGDPSFATMLIILLFIISLFALAIGAQLVRNAIALTLEERRRDLAVTGALGMPPRSILVGTMLEAAVMGAIGGVLGVGGGVLVARPLVDAMSKSLDEITGLQLSVHVPLHALVAGVVLGVVTSTLAAIGPARRASKLDVAAELQGHARRDETATALRPRTAVISAVLALGAVGLTWLGASGGAVEPWQPPLAYLGFALSVILGFRAVQHGAPPLLSLTMRLPFLRSGTARMAVSNLVGEPKRTSVMVLALGAAIGTGVLLGNLNASIEQGARDTSERLQSDRLILATVDLNNGLGIAARPSPAVIEAVSKIEGVASVSGDVGFCGEHPAVRSFCVNTGDGSSTPFRILRGKQTAAEVLAADEVLIGPSFARVHGLRPGDAFELPGRTGMRELRVGGIWQSPNNLGMSVAMSRERFAEMYGDHPWMELFVEPAPGVDLADLEARIEAAALDPDLRVLDHTELADEFATSIAGFVAPFASLQRAMLVVALVAVASTMLLVGVQRKREHGLLVAIGVEPAGLARMIATEAALVGLAGAVLGTLGGMLAYTSMLGVAPVLTGLVAPMGFDPLGPISGALLGIVVVLAAAALPSLRSARLDPAHALRYE